MSTGMRRNLPRLTGFVSLLLAIGVLGAASPGLAAAVKIVALGASDTAGPFVADGETYPAQLQAALRSAGYVAAVENAGRSGDTTEYIRRRADGATAGAQIVILQPGGNDQLGGRLQGGRVLDPAQTAANIDATVKDLRGRNVQVLMFGYGRDLTGQDTAARYGAVFLGGFFEGVPPSAIAGTHMKAEGYAIVVARILPQVKAVVDRVLHP